MLYRGVFLLLCLLFPLDSSVARETVKFDFAWRFKVYPSLHCDASTFLFNVTDLKCYGLSDNRASTPDLCRDACCSLSTCEIWQFTYGVAVPCQVGISSNCTTAKEKIIGQCREQAVDPSPKASSTPETSKTYDDSEWEIVDVPHDSIISQPYQPRNEMLAGYLPKNSTWYRKHFNLPSEWKGQSIWLYFEGIYRASSVYLNGHYLLFHDSGYTSFSVRLDNASNITFGDGKENENVLAVRCLASGNSGSWYEGSGIYRHVYLVATSKVHLVQDGISVEPNITGAITPHVKGDISKGVYANVTFDFKVNVVNDNLTGDPVNIFVLFTIYDENMRKVGSIASAKVNITTQESTMIQSNISVAKAELWSNLRPYMYLLQVDVMSGAIVLDTVNTSIGARRVRWDPNNGYFLNGARFIWRGFSSHNHFAGVGIGVPDRVNLFQAQSMRAVGGNAWRMSNNPPTPGLLDILDRLGINVWNENREFGSAKEWVQNYRDMVKRDRNHPSVMVWSLCEGAECLISDWFDISQTYKTVSYQEDPLHPVSASMPLTNSTTVLDVQGFYRPAAPGIDTYHKKFPAKPSIVSECCLCESQRGEDISYPMIISSFNANCTQPQTSALLSRPFLSGCLVWSLFDYFGEPLPLHWPHVSSSYGSFDLAGFSKASAYWFRVAWLYNARNNPKTLGHDVTYNAPKLLDPSADPSAESNGFLIHIVQNWSERPNALRHNIQVYTNAPQAELVVNGQSHGVQPVSASGWVQWNGIVYIPGSLKAFALSQRGDVVATHTRYTTEIPAEVVAIVDVPSESTGTGTSLVLDGQDTGMVHAAIVDSKGNLVNFANNNVTFRIVSGPGRIIGVGNGDPACHEPNQVTWRSAYHGLARALVQVTTDQASPPLHRKRLLQIDSDGGVRTVVVPPGAQQPVAIIVVEASVEGLGSSVVSIPVSADTDNDGVLRTARQWSINQLD